MTRKCETLTGWALIPGTCTVVYMDEVGATHPIDFSFLLDKVAPDELTSLTFNYLTKTFTYTDEAGEDHDIDISSCFPPPSTFGYDVATHTVTHNGIPHLLNCGALGFNAATCELSYTNEKGDVVSYTIPRDRFIYDPTACTFTILPAKASDAALVIPVGATEEQVGIELVDDKVLSFTYKNKKCEVTLPNSVIGTMYTCADNTLRILYCNGAEVEHALAKCSLNCIVLDDGTQVLQFSDGCGVNKSFSIPAVVLDTDALTVAGSVLTFSFGGDGNDATVTVDICQIVGDNCNATFTQINPDGSWSFIDNKGQPHNYPAPRNCCAYHTLSPAALDVANPPAAPANPPVLGAVKTDGDTLVEHHPNGVAWFTCQAGTWSFDFMHVQDGNCCHSNTNSPDPLDDTALPVAPSGAPATSNDGDTLLENHPNGLCAWTKVLGVWQRNWCRVDPVEPDDCCHYHEISVTAIDPLNPPSVPAASPADPKTAGDTLHVSHANGSCYYTCTNGNWAFDFCKIEPVTPADCCHYHQQSVTPIDEDNLPAAPADSPSGEDKSDGDTMHVAHPNGSCYYTCVAGAWELDFCKVDPPVPSDCCHFQTASNTTITAATFPVTPASAPANSDPSEGDTLQVCHLNGSCYYTHNGTDWVLDFCKMDTPNTPSIVTAADDSVTVTPVTLPNGSIEYQVGVEHPDFPDFPDDCCHFQTQETSQIDPAAPPAAPTTAFTDMSPGDTLHVNHPNGSCYYTRTGTAWVLDFCRVDPAATDDCCHFHAQATGVIDPAAPPAAPTTAFTDMSPGDTLHVNHPNGSCYYTRTGTAWVLDFCRVDPAALTLVNACAGTPVVSGAAVFTKAELITSGAGFNMPFSRLDSGDGCTPNPVDACFTDIHIITMNPSGCWYESLAGTVDFTPMYDDVRDGDIINLRPARTAPVVGVPDPQANFVAIGDPVCWTIENPDPCLEMHLDFLYNLRASIRGIYDDGMSRSIKASAQFSIDGGANFFNALSNGVCTTFAHTNTALPGVQQCTDTQSTRMFYYFVPPGGSLDICWRAIIENQGDWLPSNALTVPEGHINITTRAHWERC